MRVIVNGEPADLPAGATVDAAVAASGADPSGRGLAVAVDGEVVPRGRWSDLSLDDGQRVEVLHAVQGG